jgi:DNA-binding transcriptional MerR regulator
MQRFYSMPELTTLLSVSYNRIYWAVRTGVVHPQRSGRARLFGPKDVETLRQHLNRGQNVDAIRAA